MSVGGTKKQCPKCKVITICTAISPTKLGKPSGQRWRKPEHSDISWFRRGLECQTCSHKWLSAEIPETYLTELVELRGALGKSKKMLKAILMNLKKHPIPYLS